MKTDTEIKTTIYFNLVAESEVSPEQKQAIDEAREIYAEYLGEDENELALEK